MELESIVSHLGVAGSAVSMLTTGYFWFVRMRQERPCLKPYLADHEFFLGLSRDGVRQLGFKVGVIVANHSSLPNAILGARLWVRLQDDWQEVDNLAFDKQTPQPFNLPPLQTVLLRLTGAVSFAYEDALEGSSRTAANYLDAHVARPIQVKLELRHLNERTDTHVLTASAEEKSAQASRPHSAAA
jgi:hypothetical protein